MLSGSLFTAAIEQLCNATLYQQQALKAARQPLLGKVLRLSLREFTTPLVFIFAEQRLDVLNQWQDSIDAEINTRLAVLTKLGKGEQLTELLRNGDLQVQGDLQLVQHFAHLLDLARADPAHWFSSVLGDTGAEAVSRVLSRLGDWIADSRQRTKGYLTQAVTEEWRLAPGYYEAGWFSDEINTLASDTASLTKRLDKLEGK